MLNLIQIFVSIFVVFSHNPESLPIANKRDGVFDRRTTRGNPFDQPGITPKTTAPQLIGRTNSGCLKGAKSLDLSETNYFVLNQYRNAHWGHPKTIEFVEQLAKWSMENNDTRLKIMDIGLPYGGPATPRHASHQLGIDIDITFEQEALSQTPSGVDREFSKVLGVIEAEPVSRGMDIVSYRLNAHVTDVWTQKIFTLVKSVAQDPRVNRIFANPVIRNRFCQEAGVSELVAQYKKTHGIPKSKILPASQAPDDLQWLRKLRFVGGHTYHFHVRLHQCFDCDSNPLAAPYQNTDWGLGCNLNTGPNAYWLQEKTFSFDAGKKIKLNTFLQQKAVEHFCQSNRQANVCTSLAKLDPAPESNNRRTCYNIKVYDQNKHLGNVTKCVPKACARIIENH